jgi:hypothetical protein
MAFGGSGFAQPMFAGADFVIVSHPGHGYIIDFPATAGTISDHAGVGTGTISDISLVGGAVVDSTSSGGSIGDSTSTGGYIRDRRGDEP